MHIQVYIFIGRSLNASLSQLGTLTLCRALVQVGTVGTCARNHVLCRVADARRDRRCRSGQAALVLCVATSPPPSLPF